MIVPTQSVARKRQKPKFTPVPARCDICPTVGPVAIFGNPDVRRDVLVLCPPCTTGFWETRDALLASLAHPDGSVGAVA